MSIPHFNPDSPQGVGRVASLVAWPVITCQQLRMARYGLGLGVRDLSAKSGVSAATITRAESGHPVRLATLTALKVVLEDSGAVFVNIDGLPGVLMKEGK